MRDFIGYANRPPQFRWPGDNGLAVNIVLNYEEGSEYQIGEGDGRSEKALIEISQPRVPAGERDLAAESMYEYGSRVGFWRLHRMFVERDLPLTVFAAAQALERNPEVAAAIARTDWDIACHGWRWVEHYLLDEETERRHIAQAYNSVVATIGRAPAGWYSRYSRSMATRRLVVEHGGYAYDSDAYNDDVPYWVTVGGRPHVVVPYSLVTNDAKFVQGGWVTGRSYAEFLIESFDMLLKESRTQPRLMSIGLHPRVIGHPGRASGLERFLDHVAKSKGAWMARRQDIASHWAASIPFDAVTAKEST
ncbi:polysaccharide deacetylase family protein [Rhizobium sp. RU36D]|uniref:polysaccharide deacetylase family protein n=1 Tax=Rhizobium sp. RU36D TaxID=1907415 RepID=UPI0009D8B980|nr:polysaccharide deacetylase family protein [Rhizobium sp. RU36D]SMC51281.1 Peptidoglycan/xylan/chitin deacetylase, PgdA/CDA1 family [Rhizobium sp. RU36D]